VQRKEGKQYGDKLNAATIAAVNSTLTDLLAWAGVSKTGSDGIPSQDGFYLMGYFAFQVREKGEGGGGDKGGSAFRSCF
jgi:hypothetical protein